MVRMTAVPVNDNKSPKRYRLIQVSVEAMPLTKENLETVSHWCGGFPVMTMAHEMQINIPTLQGVKRVRQGDYVVRDSSGRFDVMHPAAFEAKYELVTPA